jgi:hypothetical protein
MVLVMRKLFYFIDCLFYLWEQQQFFTIFVFIDQIDVVFNGVGSGCVDSVQLIIINFLF